MYVTIDICFICTVVFLFFYWFIYLFCLFVLLSFFYTLACCVDVHLHCLSVNLWEGGIGVEGKHYENEQHTTICVLMFYNDCLASCCCVVGKWKIIVKKKMARMKSPQKSYK